MNPWRRRNPRHTSRRVRSSWEPVDNLDQVEGRAQASLPIEETDLPQDEFRDSPWMMRPPWHHGWHSDPAWQGKRRFLFARLARFLGFLLLVFVLGMAGLSFLLSRIFSLPPQAPLWPMLVAFIIIVGGLLMAGRLVVRSFARSIEPLARVMAAADAVTDGDLSVRVPEGAPGDFGRLQRAFNRMVTELQRTDQQRRNLTADVAHELRTPLHVIQGNLEGILDGVYPADTAQIELLLDETRQLSRLVEDLRTLSLAEAGQLPLHFETIDANDLLDDVATSFSGQAESAGVELVVDITPPQAGPTQPPLTIHGDPGRLDQVLSNLVANALCHTPAGGRVWLQAEALASAGMSAGPGVRLRVSDTGSGILPDDLPFIFDRFWRGDRARQKTGQGSTGLGLAISRQLVQAHGGRISVESIPGERTTFTIDLPAQKHPQNSQ